MSGLQKRDVGSFSNPHPRSDRSSSVAPADMAQQSTLLKEEQLRREEEKLKEIEMRVQRDLLQRRQELSESGGEA